MSVLRGVYYSRPQERYVFVDREPVDDQCPECSGVDICVYPAFTARGPRIVTKCQTCFATLQEERPSIEATHPPFWPMTRNWEATRAG